MTKSQQGLLLGIAAYLLWSVLSLYWKLLAGVDPFATFSYRILWSMVTMLVYMLVTRQRKRFKTELTSLIRDKKQFGRASLAAGMIALNWLTYIYAIASGQATQASLGYYMMPLVSVLLALIVLREHLSRATGIAVLTAALGVAILVYLTGRLPYVTLILAFSFGFYGLLKKGSQLSSDVAMLFEAGLIAPIVLVYLIGFNHESLLDYSLFENVLLVLSGLVTAIPLLLYAEALKRAPLNLVGFIQYLNPTLQLLIALFVFKETINLGQIYGLIFIWLAIIIFILEQVILLRKKRLAG